jgi:hypothetical protein
VIAEVDPKHNIGKDPSEVLNDEQKIIYHLF